MQTRAVLRNGDFACQLAGYRGIHGECNRVAFRVSQVHVLFAAVAFGVVCSQYKLACTVRKFVWTPHDASRRQRVS